MLMEDRQRAQGASRERYVLVVGPSNSQALQGLPGPRDPQPCCKHGAASKAQRAAGGRQAERYTSYVVGSICSL